MNSIANKSVASSQNETVHMHTKSHRNYSKNYKEMVMSKETVRRGPAQMSDANDFG